MYGPVFLSASSSHRCTQRFSMSHRIRKTTTMAGQRQASQVLMIRHLPASVSDRELEAWASQFTYFHPGNQRIEKTSVVKTLIVAEKQLGFVQMTDKEAALAIMNEHRVHPHHHELLAQGRSFQIKPGDLIFSDKETITATPKPKGQISTSDRECRILLVVLKNLSGTVQLTEIFWLFSQFGKVEKISSFVKNMKNQVLVQFSQRKEANVAMSYLNGKPIEFRKKDKESDPNYEPTTCTFSIVPSRLPQLTFRNQDRSNRDYEEQNYVLEGNLEAIRTLTGCEVPEWMEMLPRSQPGDVPNAQALRLRLNMIKEKGFMMKFYGVHKDFLWGLDVSGKMEGGVLNPPQDPSMYGRIPEVQNVAEAGGIPDGKVGDCGHYKNLGASFKAIQLWRLSAVFGDVIAAKLHYKYPGSASVQFRNTVSQAWATEALNKVTLVQGEPPLEVQQGKNPNALHWAGAGTELDENMVTFKGNKPPPMHPKSLQYAKEYPTPSPDDLEGYAPLVKDIVERNKTLKIGTKPTRAVLLWSTDQGGLRPELEEEMAVLLEEAVPHFAGNVVAYDDFEGKCSYIAEMDSIQDAVRVVVKFNGEPCQGIGANHVGVTFVDEDFCDEIVLANSTGAGADGFGAMPRTVTHADPAIAHDYSIDDFNVGGDLGRRSQTDPAHRFGYQ